MYLQTAKNFMGGHGLSMYWENLGPFYCFVPPGLPIFHVFFMKTFHGSFHLAERTFFLLLSASCVTVYFSLLKKFFSPIVALLGTLWLLLYVPNWFWSTRIDPHSFPINLLIVIFYFFYSSLENKSNFKAWLTGLGWGLITLMRQEYFLGVFIFCAVYLVAFKSEKCKWRLISFMIVGWMVFICPWTIRNYFKTGCFVPTSTYYSYNLWLVWNPRYDYTGNTLFEPEPLRSQLVTASNEMGRVKLWVGDALKYMKNNPLMIISRVSLNFLNFWRPWLSSQAVSFYKNLIYIISWCPLFISFLIGLFYLPWKNPQWMAVWIFILYKISAHMPFYIIVRFRETIAPILMIVALLPVEKLVNKILVNHQSYSQN